MISNLYSDLDPDLGPVLKLTLTLALIYILDDKVRVLAKTHCVQYSDLDPKLELIGNLDNES